MQADRAQTHETETVIEDRDFEARFDGAAWVIKWKWKDGQPTLRNSVDSYASTIRPGARIEFDAEVQIWIAKGWLKPWRKRPGGLISLMAVEQPSKNKVRPVLDFRKLNEFIECHTGDGVAICDETLRRWRRLVGPLKIVDLKSAYLIKANEVMTRRQLFSVCGKLTGH